MANSKLLKEAIADAKAVKETALANAKLALEEANRAIAEARGDDGNEGLTVNDVTPDWIRVRGFDALDIYTQNGWSFNWGPVFPITL